MPSPLSMARRRHLLALASSATLLATLPPFARPVHAAAPSGAGTSPEVGARPPRHEGVTPGSPLSADATPNSPPPLGSTAADGVFPRTIRHWAGSTTLERPPVRVAVLSTGQADGLLTLGVVPAGATRDDRGALISDYLMQAYPAFRDGIAQVADLGTRQSADMEAIAALQPDLILVNRAATPPSVLAQYQRIAPTVVTRGTGFHWRADFVLLADALGKREAAERWLRDFVQRGQTFGRWFAARKAQHDGADSARQKVAGSDGLSTGRANTTRDAATSSQGTAPGSTTGSPAGSVPSSALTGISFVQAGDGGNSTKNDKHGVSQGEAEQVFFNTPLLLSSDTKHNQTEQRFHALGKTDTGRLLHITFTLRKAQTLIRVISARDMHRKERTVYEQQA